MAERPLKVVQVGGVKFSIWRVPKEGYEDINVKFEGKSYKDSKGEWQTTNSLFKSDLIKMQVAINEIINWVFIERPQQQKQDTQKAEDVPVEDGFHAAADNY